MKTDPVKSRQERLLKRLVSIRRQNAEQTLMALQARRADLEHRLLEMTAALGRLDEVDSQSGELSLSLCHGYVEYLLKQMSDCDAEIILQEKALADAKQALRRALHSENQISAGSR